MSAATQVEARPVAEQPPRTRRRVRGERGRGVAVAAAVCLATILLSLVPVVGNRDFYYNNDSASQLVPMWYHLGTQIRGGHWPVLLDPNSWMGGNLAAEALFGVFNPVLALTQVLVSLMPNLVVAATLLKTGFMAFLALGCYLLAREYGAARWAAAPVALAVPFAGFTLYFQADAWLSGLIAIAWLPHVWWSLHRVAHGRLNPLWAFLIGALAVTVGNPYGLLGVIVVVVAVLAECALTGDRRALRVVFATGACVGLVAPLVYLPLMGTSSVSWRTDLSIVYNGQLAPRPGDLLGLSSPTYVPFMVTFGKRPTNVLPVGYLAWFVLPLLPWLRWSQLRRDLRPLSGLLIGAALLIGLAFGPSHLWMFRWPLRVQEPGYLALAMLFAVGLSRGLATEHARRRAWASVAIVAGGGYLAMAERPHLLGWHLAATALIALLVVLAIRAGLRRRRLTGAVLAVGTAAVLVLQVACFPANRDVTNWRLTGNVAQLRSEFAGYHGETLQLISGSTLRDSDPAVDRIVLPGNTYLPAGVDAVNSYSGIGFRPFADYLCMRFLGDTCRQSYARLYQPTDLGGRPVADLMGLQTLVVENTLPFHPIAAKPGWAVQSRDGLVTVLTRVGPALPWADGRLSYAPPGIDVLGDRTTDSGQGETVRLGSTGPGGVVAFTRLAWPGYRAQLDGRDLPVSTGPAGLLTVRLPARVRDARLRLSWTPPHLGVGVAAALAGLLGALLLAAMPLVRRRRASRELSRAANRR